MERKDRFVAVQKAPGLGGAWYCCIECGKWMMIPASMQFFRREETGIVYQWYMPILDPPADLVPYQEIHGKFTEFFELLPEPGVVVEGFENQENMIIELLHQMGSTFGINPKRVSEFIAKNKPS